MNKIVPNLSPEELLSLFRKEANIYSDGKCDFKLRGTARLLKKNLKTIQRIIEKVADGKNLSLELEDFAGQRVTADGKIPDIFVSALIDHYAALKDEHCRRLRKTFGAVGIRAFTHQAQNWEQGQSQTDSIAYRYLLPEPRAWDKQFPDEFYGHLERLTGISPKGANRPHYWANLTNELVYGYLPKPIADGVRTARDANEGFDRLHQYLSPDGLEMLKKHLEALMILLSAAGSVDDVKQMALRRFAGQYQLGLKLK